MKQDEVGENAEVCTSGFRILIIDFCDDLVLVEGGLADALEAEFLDAEIGGLLDQGFEDVRGQVRQVFVLRIVVKREVVFVAEKEERNPIGQQAVFHSERSLTELLKEVGQIDLASFRLIQKVLAGDPRKGVAGVGSRGEQLARIKVVQSFVDPSGKKNGLFCGVPLLGQS